MSKEQYSKCNCYRYPVIISFREYLIDTLKYKYWEIPLLDDKTYFDLWKSYRTAYVNTMQQIREGWRNGKGTAAG